MHKKYLSAKDIRELYWEPVEQKYTKSMKTVYRYIDLLQKEGLIVECGYRKPVDSHMTEKLYCRTAMVFTQKEEDRGPRWYETEKGKEDLRDTSRLILRFFEGSEDKMKDVEELLVKYYSERDTVVRDLLQKLAKDEKMAETMVKIGMNEFKSMASLLGMLGVLMNLSEFQKHVKDTLS